MSSPTNSSFSSSSPVRENRWKGPVSTWQRITEEERGLAASLDELRNRDLSVHLYNSFALKKRAKELNAKDAGNNEDADQYDSGGFVPPKNWTAWPIEATKVPRDGEQIGPDDADEMYTLRKKEFVKLSKDLEDILMGVTLKYAKERFRERKTAKDHEEHVEDGGDIGEMDVDKPQQEVLADLQDTEERIEKSSEQPPNNTILRPEVSADDERSRELLQPSVRHTLSKLDDVLMALHHSRKTCRQYASHTEIDTGLESRSRATSITGDVADKDSPVKRSAGRPRKLKPIELPPFLAEFTPIDDSIDDPELWRAKKTHRGRPKKIYERLEGETQHEYLTRVARIQKKPLPKFAPPIEPSTPKRGVTPVAASPQKSPRKPSEKSRKHMLGLRDWSEVLGSAALVGFSPEVIARAAQRCANLFGEHMTMRTMVEGPVIGGKEDTIAEYYPGMIPDLGESDDSVSSFVENEKESSNSTSDPENVENEETLPMKHKIYYCSVGECHGNKVGFRTTARLLRHAQVDHNLSKSKPKALQIDSDEEMDGAVHNDRFLKPVTGKRGWRGTDKEKRKRRKSKVDRKEGSVLSDEGPGDENEHVDSYSESNSDSRLESESESELESEKQDGDNHEVGSNGRNGSVV